MKCLQVAFLCLIAIDLHARLPQKQSQSQAVAQTSPASRIQLTALAEQYKNTDPDSLQLVVQQLYKLVKQDPGASPWAALYDAIHKNITGQAAASLQLSKQYISLVAGNTDLLLKWYPVAGMSLMKLNRQLEALDTFYTCLRVAEEAGNQEVRYKMYNNIGWAFMELNRNEKAIGNFKMALQIIHENNLPDRYASIYNNLAGCYGALGQYDSTRKYVQTGITIARETNDYAAEANGLNIMGSMLSAQQQYRQALDYFLQAKPIRKMIGDPFYIVSDLSEIAALQARLGDTAAGLASCREALHIAEEHKLQAKLPLIYQAMADNYEAGGNYKEATAIYKKINALKDQLYEDANPGAIAEIQTRYETEIKENQIQQQQFAITRQYYLLVGIAALLVLGGLLTYSYYHRYQLKQEARLKNEILYQQQIATLAVLEAEEKERQRIAKDLHDGIGQMMSAAKMNLSAIEHELPFKHEDQKLKFDKIIGLVDDSCKEVRLVSHNMMPITLLKSGLGAAIREFIDKVDNNVLNIELYHEGFKERLDNNVETILYRVIQECVNNVIKHAAASHLTISLLRDADGLSATVEDNGVGFDSSKKKEDEGIGLKNIRTRIEYLKGSVDFDTRPGNGTLVAIHVPLQACNN